MCLFQRAVGLRSVIRGHYHIYLINLRLLMEKLTEETSSFPGQKYLRCNKMRCESVCWGSSYNIFNRYCDIVSR